MPRAATLLPFGLLLGSIAAYTLVREVFKHASYQSPEIASLVTVVAILAAMPFARLRYEDVPRYVGIFVRWIGVTVLMLVLFDAVSLLPGVPNVLFDGGPGTIFFRYTALLAIAAGIIGWRRPAFLVPLLGFYFMYRQLMGKFTEIHVVKTDFLSMVDTGMLALVGTLLVTALCSPWLAARVPPLASWHRRVNVDEVRSNSTLLVWSCAVGGHLANYFWSGMMKLHVGGTEPWTWLFENPTQTSILMGLERGDNLLMAWPALLNFIWHAIVMFILPLNILVLGAQLLSPLAAIGKKTLLTFTVFFDFFHLIVWFTLGALFHYWIVVNVLVFISARKLGIKRFTGSMQLVMAASVLVAPQLFYVNYLGWLDAAKLTSPQIIAHTKDGRSITVPGPFYGQFSYNIAQNRLYTPDGAFPNWQAGNHSDVETWRDARTCGPMRAAKQKVQYTSLGAVVNMIQRTDQFARTHPWYKNENTYYFYPHHMMPNPWHFREFNALRIEDITGYTYRVDSVCLDLRDGRLHRDVKHSWEYKVPVSNGGAARP